MSMSTEEVLERLGSGKGGDLFWVSKLYEISHGFRLGIFAGPPIFGQGIALAYWEPREPTPAERASLNQEVLQRVIKALESDLKTHYNTAFGFVGTSMRGSL
jgi:hypothetical protein